MHFRPYTAGDEHAWLRCRLLAFFDTAYFDDVVRAKPRYEQPAVEVVATTADQGGPRLAGVLDVSIDGALATIETIATHPEHQRAGVATSLLDDAIARLPGTVEQLDAWTRDDVAANSWYERCGFAETFRYLHVYATSDPEVEAAVAATHRGLVLARGFFHAPIEGEAEMRSTFARVHVCRRYLRDIG